jgi:hypothetical protein
MNMRELLRRFLQVPELSTVGSSQERAAFIALRIDGHTVRTAGQAIGISKSGVANLANLFQAKLKRKMIELGKKGESTWSAEYGLLYAELSELMPDGYDEYGGGHKIGNFSTDSFSQEDWAEVRRGASPRFDDE